MKQPLLWPLDDDGLVALPLRLYLLLLLLLRPILSWILALTIPEQKGEMLAFFYPDQQQFWLACLLALPTIFLCVALTQRRPKGHAGWFRIWRYGKWLLLATLIPDLILTIRALPPYVAVEQPWLLLAPSLLVIGCLWLLRSRRVPVIFSEWPEPAPAKK
ncbi:DUF2919 family protein [Alkalimonas sp.]|uniref:DUF2919 family protein n=1 Tax=Alkalimonas sp. TaxID=1872453 RepID=UPI00263B65C4|nr:DUF2919 family protein [Alkalimonas sp.]MCC5827122.1 DUF2919 family protein [Alkalimonas sp.]